MTHLQNDLLLRVTWDINPCSYVQVLAFQMLLLAITYIQQ